MPKQKREKSKTLRNQGLPTIQPNTAPIAEPMDEEAPEVPENKLTDEGTEGVRTKESALPTE